MCGSILQEDLLDGRQVQTHLEFREQSKQYSSGYAATRITRRQARAGAYLGLTTITLRLSQSLQSPASITSTPRRLKIEQNHRQRY
jgi:hypothetical protein